MRILLFSWLFVIPLLQILSGKDDLLFVSGQCLEDQRSSLLKLKASLHFDPTSSTKLVTWNNSINCCRWEGLRCDNFGHVIRLELDNEAISGKMGNLSSLFNLQYLEMLNLAYNNFNSLIPVGLSTLANLTYLNLSSAGFFGQIPLDLARLSRLVILDLSTPFPIQPLKMENPNLRTLIQNLKELRKLHLDGVNISAPGGEWCNALSSLSYLSVLSLSNCYLSGPIDSSLSELHSLSVIKLDNNNLSSSVPDFFANFSSLTSLSLSSCGLQGKFPENILQVPTLQNLDLSQNSRLSGSLPQFTESGSFRTIVISYTNFSGSLPDSIGFLRVLSRLDLSNCNFNGKIPSTMTNLTELLYLDFSFNNFMGTIPSFQLSKKLQYIDFSRNNLTGPIPFTHLEGLTSLSFINLGYNSINGSIPPSLFTLPLLQKLQLSNNRFDGQVNEFPNATNSKLDTLDLSSNQLKGSIPKSFFELEKLNVLSLSNNFFRGTVQLEMIKKLPNLTKLELSGNNLSIDATSSNSTMSTFPQLSVLKLASCNLHNFPVLNNQLRMIHLDLSDNEITGKIPRWIWKVGNGTLQHLNLSCNHLVDLEKDYNMPNLLVLDLHSNQLQGKFPIPPKTASYVDYSSNKFNNSISPHIGEAISFANFFSLSNNALVGHIPESICNASYLQVLDLSNNTLTGRIPDCLFENMEALGVLNLGRNRLNGAIPNNFSVSCTLKTLDLSRNTIEGNVPQSLINCKSLEVLNIGNNKIEDTFPCMLKNVSSLRVLVIRSNRFHGDLNCSITKESWSRLQILDIASNNFSGNLSPSYFSNWRGMKRDKEKGELDQGHLYVKILGLSSLYYQDTVTVTFKGLELELVKILTVFTSIDFSRNKFEGEIPETVGELNALHVLNFSQNALTEKIPKSIGNLTTLESLDLSMNQLIGTIPMGIADLTFLSFLNLSFNQLVGRIPSGRQFQTFTEASFKGNDGLCGFPLNASCKGNNDVLVPSTEDSPTGTGFNWQFIFTGLGFGVGAAIIVAPLIVLKEGRNWCDKHSERILLLIFPRYRFTYTRYDEGKVKTAKNQEEEFQSEDYDEDEFEEEHENEAFRGKYCVFCSKLDAHRKKAVHNPKCNCHTSSPIHFSSPASPSLLLLYHQHF